MQPRQDLNSLFRPLIFLLPPPEYWESRRVPLWLIYSVLRAQQEALTQLNLIPSTDMLSKDEVTVE